MAAIDDDVQSSEWRRFGDLVCFWVPISAHPSLHRVRPLLSLAPFPSSLDPLLSLAPFSTLFAQAKDLVEGAPCTIMTKVKKEEATKIMEKLKTETGAELELV
jgi:hypothetical protein